MTSSSLVGQHRNVPKRGGPEPPGCGARCGGRHEGHAARRRDASKDRVTQLPGGPLGPLREVRYALGVLRSQSSGLTLTKTSWQAMRHGRRGGLYFSSWDAGDGSYESCGSPGRYPGSRGRRRPPRARTRGHAVARKPHGLRCFFFVRGLIGANDHGQPEIPICIHVWAKAYFVDSSRLLLTHRVS